MSFVGLDIGLPQGCQNSCPESQVTPIDKVSIQGAGDAFYRFTLSDVQIFDAETLAVS